jgi:hypothetical protein
MRQALDSAYRRDRHGNIDVVPADDDVDCRSIASFSVM